MRGSGAPGHEPWKLRLNLPITILAVPNEGCLVILNEEAEAVKLLTRDRTASAASDPFGSDGARSPRADALEAQSRSMAQQMEDLRQEGLRREKETQSQLAAILEELKQLRQQGR